jgi:hypothetical protein
VTSGDSVYSANVAMLTRGPAPAESETQISRVEQTRMRNARRVESGMATRCRREGEPISEEVISWTKTSCAN